MERDERRITLIAYDKQRDERSWDFSEQSTNRIVFIESFGLLRSTVTSPLVRTDSDIERIVLDRCSTEGEYLSLLADLPHSFTGDVLMIRTDSTGFLSATGRGGDRILYSLGPEDVEFYLETVRLVQPSEALQRHVLKFRPRVIESIEGHAVNAQ